MPSLDERIFLVHLSTLPVKMVKGFDLHFMNERCEKKKWEKKEKKKSFWRNPPLKAQNLQPKKGPNLQQTLLLQQKNPPPTFFFFHPSKRKLFSLPPSPTTTATTTTTTATAGKIRSRNPKRNSIDIPTNHRLGNFFATVGWRLYV